MTIGGRDVHAANPSPVSAARATFRSSGCSTKRIRRAGRQEVARLASRELRVERPESDSEQVLTKPGREGRASRAAESVDEASLDEARAESGKQRCDPALPRPLHLTRVDLAPQ